MSTEQETMNWYVLKTISGQEHKVKNYIENEMTHLNQENHLGQIVIPMEKVVQIKNGKRITKEKVYMPGYVMIQVDLVGEIPHAIKNIPGVIGFLSATKGGDPLPMRKSDVNKMLGKVDELAESDENFNIPYNIGESVKVIDGPFNGFDGKITNINEEKRKLEVEVLIFGRKTPVELNFMQVEKV